MSRIIAYDLCRLFIGPYFATPRGIDRVDLAVADHVFADPDGPHIAILPTPLGVRAYPASVARLLLDRLKIIWGERSQSEDDVPLQRLIAGMRSPGPATGTLQDDYAAGLSRTRSILRSLDMLRYTGVRLGHPAGSAVPAGAVYVNLGQIALAVPSFFTWLQRRSDVACAMMIHDTIPLDRPEMVRPASVAHHARMIRTAAGYADGLIFSTAFAQTSVNAELAQLDQAPLPSLVRALPLAAAFTEVREGVPELADTHYFVVVSTVEPRKNFGLLLGIWEELVARMGALAPHLVIVGAPGLDADRILAPLTRSPGLRGRVHRASGLSSPALGRLVAGCAALLSPSLAEGFGLPLLEGMAMGVPIIASDIPSHREIGKGRAMLLGPDDRVGWEAAILATPRSAPGRRQPVPFEMTEAAYAAEVLAFVDSLAPQARARDRTARARGDRVS